MLQGRSQGCPIPGGRMDPSEKARRPRAIAAAPAQARKRDSLDPVSMLSCTRGMCRGLHTSQPHPMPQAEPFCSPASSGSHPASAAQRGEQEPPCSKQKGSTWIIGIPENRAPPQCTFQPNQALSIAFCCQTPGLNQPN